MPNLMELTISKWNVQREVKYFLLWSLFSDRYLLHMTAFSLMDQETDSGLHVLIWSQMVIRQQDQHEAKQSSAVDYISL